MLQFIISVAIILSVLLNVIFVWYVYTLKKYDVPGPIPLPIIGNALDFGFGSKDISTKILRFINDNSKKYNGFFRIFMGPKQTIVLGNPEVAKVMLSSSTHIDKTDLYDLFRPVMGGSVGMCGGEKWKKNRRLIEPTFYFKILEAFVKSMKGNVDVFVDILAAKANENNGIIEGLDSLTKLLALDVVCETALGSTVGALNLSSYSGYTVHMATFFDIIVERWFSAWQRNNFLFNTLARRSKEFHTSAKVINSLTREIVEKRREYLKGNIDNGTEDDNDVGIKVKRPLIDLLLKTGDVNGWTNKDIQDELNFVMTAGHETTATGIAFTIYELGQNQEIQKKLYEEVMNSYNADDLSFKNIMDMKYIEMVIKEGLRKYPPIPFIERLLVADAEIEGVKFERGTGVMIPISALHHNEEYWPCPDKFDPDRFLVENTVNRHPYAYAAFSAGPRNCVGQKFALLESKIAIAEVVKQFKILPVTDYKPIVGVSTTLKALNGLKVKLQRRN